MAAGPSAAAQSWFGAHPYAAPFAPNHGLNDLVQVSPTWSCPDTNWNHGEAFGGPDTGAYRAIDEGTGVSLANVYPDQPAALWTPHTAALYGRDVVDRFLGRLAPVGTLILAGEGPYAWIEGGAMSSSTSGRLLGAAIRSDGGRVVLDPRILWNPRSGPTAPTIVGTSKIERRAQTYVMTST